MCRARLRILCGVVSDGLRQGPGWMPDQTPPICLRTRPDNFLILERKPDAPLHVWLQSAR